MMKDGNSAKLPTTTVSPARLRMCQPTQRPTYRTGEWIETAWGRCRVTGRFGQRHQDLLDAFLWNAEENRQVEDGGLEVLVDPARVRKTMSVDGRHSLSGIQKLIRELREVTLEIETPKLSIMGSLVDHMVKSPMMRADPLHGGERHLWRVRIGLALAELLRHDLPLHYDPTPLIQLQTGVTQAVARHILSHASQPSGGWKIDGLIQAVCGELASTMIRHRRREMRIDGHALLNLGIVIDGDRVFTDGRACSTRPMKTEKASKRAAAARHRAAPARENTKTCSSRPALQDPSGSFRADASAPEGPMHPATPPPPSATPKGVKCPAGRRLSTTAAQASSKDQDPFPAGYPHPRRGSQRKLRGCEGDLGQLNLFDESAVV